jgi:RNA polymerase sigma-70 factor (ECF subfamily)
MSKPLVAIRWEGEALGFADIVRGRSHRGSEREGRVIPSSNSFSRLSLASPPATPPRAAFQNVRDSPDPDQALLDLARDGERRAFEALVVKYQRRVARLVSRYVRSAPEVEEVTQEIFVRAYRGIAAFKGGSKFSTWLYRISVNFCLNHIERERRSPIVALDTSDEEPDWNGAPEAANDEDPERRLIAKQIAATVEAALAELSTGGREALLLFEDEGLSYQEIADRTGVPIGTVRARIFRAREFIAQRLEPVLGPSRNRRW